MDIAPNIPVNDWQQLNLNNADSPDWDIAINIFRKRILERFIEPVDLLIKSEEDLPRNERRFGFAILAIDCLLIETIQSFRDGKITTEGYSRPLITKFLHYSLFRWEWIDTHIFYDDFRCGILHQAEIGGNSLVRSEGPLLIKDPAVKGLILNRTIFHKKIKESFMSYINELKNKNKTKLRVNFREKMNSICRANKLSEKYPISQVG